MLRLASAFQVEAVSLQLIVVCNFFLHKYQSHQQFDENTERVALMRRCPEDDGFVVPMNLYLTMFAPSSVNVMPFCPTRGAEQARCYATKYWSVEWK